MDMIVMMKDKGTKKDVITLSESYLVEVAKAIKIIKLIKIIKTINNNC